MTSSGPRLGLVQVILAIKRLDWPDGISRQSRDAWALLAICLAIHTFVHYLTWCTMSANSRIEWTDATWNPVRGCTKISPGCAHCYAETFAERFRGVPGHPYERGFDPRLVPDKLVEPITWSKPRMVFVNSMSDLFHESVPDGYIELLTRIMAAANWHVFQVLTKRSKRLRDLLSNELRFAARMPHIWWGVSVENRRHGLPRIVHLRDAGVATAFLSVEPLVEDIGSIDLTGIQWVIVGGESGPGARPIERQWVIDIRTQCQTANVPFFFKQWGGVRKKTTGRELDGHTYNELPAIFRNPVPDQFVRKVLIEQFRDAWPAQPTVPSRHSA
jgi:protein gp37